MALPAETNIEYVDRPVSEIFVDSIKLTTFNSGVMRIEFCTTQLQGPLSRNEPLAAKQYPVARLVMTADVAINLLRRLQSFLAGLEQQCNRGEKLQTPRPPVRH